MAAPEQRGQAQRRDNPILRQAAEGMGVVVALSVMITTVGGALALIVSLLF